MRAKLVLVQAMCFLAKVLVVIGELRLGREVNLDSLCDDCVSMMAEMGSAL